eukprot:403343027
MANQNSNLDQIRFNTNELDNIQRHISSNYRLASLQTKTMEKPQQLQYMTNLEQTPYKPDYDHFKSKVNLVLPPLQKPPLPHNMGRNDQQQFRLSGNNYNIQTLNCQNFSPIEQLNFNQSQTIHERNQRTDYKNETREIQSKQKQSVQRFHGQINYENELDSLELSEINQEIQSKDPSDEFILNMMDQEKSDTVNVARKQYHTSHVRQHQPTSHSNQENQGQQQFIVRGNQAKLGKYNGFRSNQGNSQKFTKQFVGPKIQDDQNLLQIKPESQTQQLAQENSQVKRTSQKVFQQTYNQQFQRQQRISQEDPLISDSSDRFLRKSLPNHHPEMFRQSQGSQYQYQDFSTPPQKQVKHKITPQTDDQMTAYSSSIKTTPAKNKAKVFKLQECCDFSFYSNQSTQSSSKVILKKILIKLKEQKQEKTQSRNQDKFILLARYSMDQTQQNQDEKVQERYLQKLNLKLRKKKIQAVDSYNQ